ncbi:mucin-7-like [Dermacentor albipictus]|uniref:mucin-7-like n=1 Tax=Dermacentor albipictus TaxID=60249 RepID=UPI0038FCA63B
MGARTLLLLAFLASAAALASCAAQDGGEPVRHSVKKRGILESIASGARSLRDGASEFFERSWSGIKAAFTDFMNWLRGVPSPDEVFRPPASEKPYDGEPDTGFGFEHPHHAEPCPDSKAHPTAGPTTQGSTESGTLSKSTGPASTATEAVDEEAESRVSEPSSSAAPPASVVTTTRAPSLQTTAAPAAAETVGPRVAGGDLGAPQITEAAQESTDAPQTTSETTTSETVSVSATRDFAAPTATDKTPVPSIDSTSSPTLPPEEDPFENDIDAEPSSKEPPPSRRRGNGPGFVISDGR